MNLEDYAKQLTAQKIEVPQRVLIYGPPKSGKTALAAQLARTHHLHWFDCDDGFTTILGAIPKEYWKNITLYKVYDTPSMPNAVATATKLFGSGKPISFCEEHTCADCVECRKTGKKFQIFDKSKLTSRDAVVWDSGTQLSASAMNHAIGTLGELTYVKKEFGHYDKQGLLLSNIMAYMKRMPCHVVFITHEQNLELTGGAKKIIPVMGTSNFARTVGKDFGHIVYCQLKNNKHSIVTGTTENSNIGAGNRANITIKDGTELYKLFGSEIIAEAVIALTYTTLEEEKESDTAIIEGEHTVVQDLSVDYEPAAEKPPVVSALSALQKLQAVKKSL